MDVLNKIFGSVNLVLLGFRKLIEFPIASIAGRDPKEYWEDFVKKAKELGIDKI